MPITVGFVSQKGGVGKSTLARTLAAVAAAGEVKVLLADLDPQQGTALRWSKARSAQAQGLPPITVKGFASPLQALGASIGFDLLVLDAPARSNRTIFEVAERSHLIVVPSGGSVDDLQSTVLLLEQLVQQGIAKRRLVVALSRIASTNDEQRARTYVNDAGYEVLAGCLQERSGYRDALDHGRALNEASSTQLKGEATELIEAIIKRAMTEVKALSARREKSA